MLASLRSPLGRTAARSWQASATPRLAWLAASSSASLQNGHRLAGVAQRAASRHGTAAWAPPASSHARYMHVSAPARGAGESDAELSSKLAEEITYEKESAAASTAEGEPTFLAEFRNAGIWKIEDQPGSDEIALTRDFGNEHIRVLFSIGDIDTAESEMDENDDVEAGKEEDDDSESPSFPVRCAITISKPKSGAMTIDAQAVDGAFSIENISYYKDSKLATDLTAEADWARRGLYIGPQFETLDENVQSQFESFLEERGIATDLALFIPSFAEFKEQREYCSWLENVKAFVDA